MNCPKCLSGPTRVSNTEINESGLRIRRFRNCPSCGYRFRTTQTVEKLDNDGSQWNFAKTRVRGEDAGRALFTEGDIIRMRRMYSSGEYTQLALAKIYGCSKTNVYHIIHRNSWKHVS